VTFRVVVDDPDGSQLVDRNGSGVDYGDGSPLAGGYGGMACTPGFGPTTPPTPVPVHEELALSHVYARPGTYTAKFPFQTFGNCASGPSEGSATVTVVVT
jgi:hypothetical protein